MDHAHVKGMGLFLIFVDSFSGGPEVINVAERKATTIKQILRTIFSRSGVPKTLVSDNTLEFCNKNLCSWLRCFRYIPYKTLPNDPQLNGITKRMMQTLKMGPRAFSLFNDNVVTYLSRLLLSYKTILHTVQNPFELMDRQIRAPITMAFSTNESEWYKKEKESNSEKANFVVQKE